jgi:hypothetical protein
VRPQYEVDRLSRRLQRGIIERPLGKRRREASSDQQYVAFSQGHSQSLRQLQDHIARGRGAAGFNKTQVTRRDLGIDRKVELAQMAALPPFAQMIANMNRLGLFGSRRRNMSVHGKNLAREFHRFHYL